MISWQHWLYTDRSVHTNFVSDWSRMIILTSVKPLVIFPIIYWLISCRILDFMAICSQAFYLKGFTSSFIITASMTSKVVIWVLYFTHCILITICLEYIMFIVYDDDVKLFKVVRCLRDCLAMQNVLNHISRLFKY